MKRLRILFFIVTIFSNTFLNAQGENKPEFSSLIESQDFKLLESEFKKKYTSSDIEYLNFLRASASNYSKTNLNGVAINILKYCCVWYNGENECDTIKLNNLHLLGRYYSFANETDLSLETNKECLRKRLSCSNVASFDIAKSFNNIGLYFQFKRELDSSQIYFENALRNINREDYKKSPFPNILCGNYLANLTLKGEFKKAKQFIKKWYQNSEKKEDILYISNRINQNIYECLIAKNIKGAFIYNSINERILIKQFGEKSLDLFDYRYNFAMELAKQNYDQAALGQIKKIEQKHINYIPHYEKLIARSSIGTALMNMGFNEEALKIYLELKSEFIEKYVDSSSAMMLLSNLSVCYNKLGNLELMQATRKEFFELSNRNKLNDDFQLLIEKNIDRELTEYDRINDIDNIEKTLIKAIDFYFDIDKIDKEIHNKLKLSNLYLFEKNDLSKSNKLLDDVEKMLNKSINTKEVKGYYYYQKAEFERKMGNYKKYDYYKMTLDCFDSIKFYPIEYENALMRIAEHNLYLGNFEQGKAILNRYLEFGTKDSTNIKSYNYKINYLNSLENYQSDSLNNISALSLLNQIERLFGIENATYRKAAKSLNNCIINSDYRKKIILNWIFSFKIKNDLDYYFANSALAHFYFENGKISQCDSLWENIFEESRILQKEKFNSIASLYVIYLIYDKKDFEKSLQLLSEMNISSSDFETNLSECYFQSYIGLKEYEIAYKYLSEKEKFIRKNYSENSEQYLQLVNEFIKYFEALENSILVKYYKEKELELIYVNQRNNKIRIVSKTNKLVSTLLELDLFERSLFWLDRVKNEFNINIETVNSSEDLFLLYSEQITLLNFFLVGGENNIAINDLKNNLFKIEKKCVELKKKYLVKDNVIILDILSKLIELNFKMIEDPSMNARASFVNNLSSYLDEKNLGNYFAFNSSTNKLILEGNYEEAKKQALLQNDFNTLEELELEAGNERMAFNYRFEEEKLEITKIINSSKGLTDLELEQKRKVQKNSLNFQLGRYTINLINPSNEIIEKSFELVLNNYGLISNLNRDFYRFLRNTDPEFKKEYNSLSNYKNQRLNYGSKKNENDSIMRELEFKINLKLIDRQPSNIAWVTMQNIQKTLNDSSVYILNYKYDNIDFLDNSINIKKQRCYYLTFVISKTSTTPNLIITPFDPENEKDIIDLYHNAITQKSEKQDLSFVYEKMWSKIDEQLPNKIKKVIFSPDGMYNSVNISTLFDTKNNKYIFDKYDIVIADNVESKSNDNMSQLSTAINNAVLIGFPNYSGITVSNKQNSNDSLKLNLDKYYSNATRGSIAKSLPGTKIEIAKINTLFTNNGIKTTVLIENNATEDNLKNIGAPDVLHIATHGFFINSKDGAPMFNSGLLLAGCNSKTKKIEDGYLSAYETSLLNLENTKLVVLSACETGRGVMKDGDGVFGLKQGCLNAGAQNIIMSLWKVDDKVTQEFMTRFYEIWLNEKTTIREAFHRTQLEIKAKYPQPYYWGAFILVGE
jgi:CHAT domain-containing protein